MAVLVALVMFPLDPNTGAPRKDLRVADLVRNVPDAQVPSYLAVRGFHNEKHWGLTDYADDLTAAAPKLKEVTEGLTTELSAAEVDQAAADDAAAAEIYAAEEDAAIAAARAASEAPAPEASNAGVTPEPAEEPMTEAVEEPEAEAPADKPKRGGKRS